mmetsp:Transcript_15021/g.42429  ORF Transcript_15021/g.42429 Transcript_15021/m.42429 type:complete len:88 (-) Transcript_15021:132-395(-)|eukprot:CAMPEP_0119558252 /NCGR_PEP_ID=MMETSP1352-20130426/10451_1 /TAXON_ID=265584 /ORGANISM="Stauroneis constricta, Strain CCMP1120" /LENGTH=87 /DNA_ID=CAMNT_0007605547 /DNA_START=130 /DNA_END=393 /DNA_ORIENTATION=-
MNITSTNTTDTSSTTPSSDTIGKIIMLGLIGSAAGFTLYTKRTGAMIRQLDQITKNKAQRMPPPRIGPHTKAEWEKIRPRFEKGDFF